MLETKQKYCRCLQIHQHGGTQKQTCSEGERKKLFQTFNSQKINILHRRRKRPSESSRKSIYDLQSNAPGFAPGQTVFGRHNEIATSSRRSPGSTSRGADLNVRNAPKRDYALGCRKGVYRGCRSPSHLNRHTQQTKETAQTNSTWPASVHSSKTRWSPMMVWSRYLRAQRRKRMWKKCDDVGTHEKLFTQVQSNTGWVGDQRRSQRIGNGPELGPDFSEDVRRGRLLHHTHITREEKPEDEQMSTEDNVPDVRHGRPDGQLEPKKIREASRQRRRTKSTIFVRAGAGGRKNDDSKRKYRRRGTIPRRTAYSNTRQSDTSATEDADTAIDNATEPKKSRPRGKVTRLAESGNRRNNELGRSSNILEMGSSRQKEQ